jgi:hypothetical protein
VKKLSKESCTIHGMERNTGLTACCGKTPFELPRMDRLTVDMDKVTCKIIIGEIIGDKETSK